MPTSRSDPADPARLPHLRDELLAFGGVAHRGAAAGRRPDRRDQASRPARPRAANPIGEPLDLVVARVDADVRIEQEQVDAVELDAVDRGLRGEIEHRVEIDQAAPSPVLCRRDPATWRCGGPETCAVTRRS